MGVYRVGKCLIDHLTRHHAYGLLRASADHVPEASPNNRAGCHVTACKAAGVKIMKGEFRLGVQVTIHEHQSWQFRHWYAFALPYDTSG
jgi:hypothetical protein